jgi:transcriptional regulator with XRE-family HTH domain
VTHIVTTDQVIGQHLSALRDQQNLSQRQLAEYLTRVTGNTWNQQLVSRAESGDRQFRVVDLFAVSGIFEVSVLALLFPTDPDAMIRAGNLELVASGFFPLWIAHPRDHRGDKTGYADKMPPPDPDFEEHVEGFLDIIDWMANEDPEIRYPTEPPEEHT